MPRARRSIVFLVIVLSVILPANLQGASAGSTRQSLSLQVTPLQSSVAEGGRASAFVHTGAYATLTLTVTYAANTSNVYHAVADAQGRYVFSWQVPQQTGASGQSVLRLQAHRGKLSASWSGRLKITGVPLPRLFVQAAKPSFEAGSHVSVFVSTEPGTAFTYTLTADGGTTIARGSGIADRNGRAVVTAPEPLLPKSATRVTASVTVMTKSGARTRLAHFTLTPRPPLNLFISTTAKTVRAGDAIKLFVSTRPGASIHISMAITSTVVLTGTGTADKMGRWVYSAPLMVLLQHQHLTSVTVQARSGIDQATAATRFMLRPGPANLTPYGFDRLASAAAPAPDLGRLFPTIPDKLVAVSTEGQVLREYDHGILVHENYVTTGRPELPTVHGIFHVYLKQTPFTFISPWPAGSAYYYPPSPVRYWMPFIGGYGLHDSPWRSVYGPGTNLPHYSTDPGEPVGSHGCVNIPLADMIWLWNWAPVGTTVLVY